MHNTYETIVKKGDVEIKMQPYGYYDIYYKGSKIFELTIDGYEYEPSVTIENEEFEI